MSARAEGAPRVAILGANGQVGTELCMFLHLGGFARPVAVARSEYSLAMLRRLGIESRVAADDVRRVIEDCDAVVDLVHPWQTDTKAMRNAIERRAALIFEAARPSAPSSASGMSIMNCTLSVPAKLARWNVSSR